MIQTYKTGQMVHVYELLEEIHATNYTTYVDTGVHTSSDISIEIKWKCNPNHIPQHSENDRIVACQTAWNESTTMAFDFEETPHLKWKFIGDTFWSYDNSISPDSNEHICKLSATEFVYDGNVLATHSQTSIGTSNSVIRIAQSDLSGASTEQGYYYYYYVKIWDGATLIRNYVPAKRMSDNVYGFYDTVNSTFNPSIGNKGFTGTSKSTPEYIDAIAGATKYVNDIILCKSGITTHKYEVLDYIYCSYQQYFDTDIYAQSGISVEMTCKMTNRPGNTRFFSTHDPRDTSGQNWAFASGTWGLQFEGSTMCVKMLGNGATGSSFAMTSKSYNDIRNHIYRYDLTCDGILNIYEPSDDSLWYTFDCTAGTDPTKVSQTTIRMFAREESEITEWFNGDVYDIKIKNNGTTIRHYIPVKRLSDDMVGFYDSDNDEFYPSLSTHRFTGTPKSTPEYIDVNTEQKIHINRIYNRGEIYWGNDNVIQPTYEVLEEIHADNYTTYVDTGVYTSSSISVEAKWKCNPDHMPVTGNNDRIIASSTAWNNSMTMAFDFEESPHIKYKFIGDTIWSATTSIGTDSNEHICKLSSTEFVYDGTVLKGHGQTSYGPSNSIIRIAQSNLNDVYTEQGYYYYYYVKIWDGETLVRNYVPAKRLADNVYGFYDTVNSTFNPSIGDNGFTGTSKSTPEYIY